MRRALSILLVLAVLLPGCGIPWGHLNPLFDAYRTGVWYLRQSPNVVADVPYGDDPMQKVDVYRTTGKTPAPVVFFIHGGSWQYGDRKQLAVLGKVLGEMGYVTVMPDYRMYPQVTYPAFVDDVVAALNWTVAHVAQYGGDPDCVVVAGHSAGAHLTMIPFVDDAFRKKFAFDPMKIRGLAPVSGPFDFPRIGQGAADQTKLHRIMAGDEGFRNAQPIHHVRKDLPPVLLLVGSKDTITPPGQVEAYAKLLKDAGADVELDVIPGNDHIMILLPLAKVEEGRSADVLYGFFQKVTAGCACATGSGASGANAR